MTSSTPNPVTEVVDVNGSTGSLLQRTEPKVKAATVAAFLTPIGLYFAHRYVPGLAEAPAELLLPFDAAVTGAMAFIAGFVAKVANRVDVFLDEP